MTRSLPRAVEQIGRALTINAGGYLRNTFHEPFVTCLTCATPVDGRFEFCYQCNSHVRSGMPVADRVATVVYAVESGPGHLDQTYLAMFGYKSSRPQEAHIQVVRSLLALAVIGHTDCDLALAQTSGPFRWTTVPSTRNPTREHPLHSMAADMFAPGYEIRVRTRPGFVKARDLSPADYEVLDPIPVGAHTLVIDDSWVSGGSAQSTAIAVREAGASSVSILALARILHPGFQTTAQFLRDGNLARDFDYTVCPWTGGACP